MSRGPLVVCLGEALIDFLNVGVGPSGRPLFEQNPGGAPANVARNLARLGTRVAFVGAVGGDPFGVFLRDVLAADGIDTTALVSVSGVPTTLAFIHLEDDGERTFSFVRSPGADTCLRAEDVPEEVIARASILHVGSLSLTHDASARATRRALNLAAEANVTVSCDVNLRPLLWDGMDRAYSAITALLTRCHFAKLSLEELLFVIEDAVDLPLRAAGLELLSRFPNIRLLALTMGSAGSLVLARGACGSLRIIEVPGVSVDVVDTTGAGDTYCAAMLHSIVSAGGLDKLLADEPALRQAAHFSGTLASASVTARGAVTIEAAGEKSNERPGTSLQAPAARRDTTA